MEQSHITYVLGGGCFWCIEAIFQDVIGVTKVVSGYSGGDEPNPTYESIHYADSKHAEVVQVTFDSSVISPEIILDLYFLSHNPTTLNRQGNDVGPAYRSIMLYADDQQKRAFEAAKSRAQALWDDPIVTEIVPLKAFYEAEPEQQNFFKSHPEQAYCQTVIAPKLNKVRKEYAKWFAVNRS
jgi:peptide-methionine (S)-S-oxide reductase